MVDISNFKVNSKKCCTCPFRDDANEINKAIAEEVKARMLTGEVSQICHHTNSSLCRGARNYLNIIFYRLGVIASPTDKAWEEARKKYDC